MLTLWDLIDPILLRIAPKQRAKRPVSPPAHKRPAAKPPSRPSPAAPAVSPKPSIVVRKQRLIKSQEAGADASMQGKYDAVAHAMLEKYGIRVRKWRKGMSGIAWYVTYRDGRVQRLIEAPRPRGPMSAAVFLHEIGHHAIGFNVYKPRCLEEYHAWRWSIEAMQANGLNITDAVRLRMHRSLWYAVEKAKRRGIKQIPAELGPFMEKPSFARRRGKR